jgi:hypothetical protein
MTDPPGTTAVRCWVPCRNSGLVMLQGFIHPSHPLARRISNTLMRCNILRSGSLCRHYEYSQTRLGMRHVSNSAKVFVHSQRKRKPKKLAKTKLGAGSDTQAHFSRVPRDPIRRAHRPCSDSSGSKGLTYHPGLNLGQLGLGANEGQHLIWLGACREEKGCPLFLFATGELRGWNQGVRM